MYIKNIYELQKTKASLLSNFFKSNAGFAGGSNIEKFMFYRRSMHIHKKLRLLIIKSPST